MNAWGQPGRGHHQGRASSGQQDRQAHDLSPAETVGGGSGDEDEQEQRRELHEPDQPRIERVAGQVINLPEHRNRKDLRPEGREQACDPVDDEVPVAEGGEPSAGRLGRTFRCGVSHGGMSGGGIASWVRLIGAGAPLSGKSWSKRSPPDTRVRRVPSF
jgi:hypothetical protein